jgi:hypothetical protein
MLVQNCVLELRNNNKYKNRLNSVLYLRSQLSNSKFYRVLTMVYNTQHYWGFGLYPSPGF